MRPLCDPANPSAEDLGRFGKLLVDDVRIDPQRDRRISDAQPRTHPVGEDARQEEGRRMDVAEGVKPRMRERFGR
jgi:hypothetical protein